MPFKIVFTADLHGNEAHYTKLVDYANELHADAVILGGDLAPNFHVNAGNIAHIDWKDLIGVQRTFLEQRLPVLLKRLAGPKAYLILGNDDARVNVDILQNRPEFTYIDRSRVRLTDNLELIGYSTVPITPFGIKDWEKHDLREYPPGDEAYLFRNRRFQGMKSTPEGWCDFSFPTDKSDCIENDLAQSGYTNNAQRTIHVMHSPPDSILDVIRSGAHVGSFAIRKFIDQKQPLVTLHGHIHETVEMTGRFIETRGNTVCLAPGNNPHNDKLALLVLDAENPKDAKRYLV